MCGIDLIALFEAYPSAARRLLVHLDMESTMNLAQVSRVFLDFFLRERVIWFSAFRENKDSYFKSKFEAVMWWSSHVKYTNLESERLVKNFFYFNELGIRREIIRAWKKGSLEARRLDIFPVEDFVIHPSRTIYIYKYTGQEVQIFFQMASFDGLGRATGTLKNVYNIDRQVYHLNTNGSKRKKREIPYKVSYVEDFNVFGMDLIDDYVVYACSTRIYVHDLTTTDMLCEYNSQDELDEQLRIFPISDNLRIFRRGSTYWIVACSHSQSLFSVFKFKETVPSVERHTTIFLDGKISAWGFQWPHLALGTTDHMISVFKFSLEESDYLNIKRTVKFKQFHDHTGGLSLGKVACLKADPNYILSTHYVNDIQLRSIEQKKVVRWVLGYQELAHNQFNKVQDIAQSKTIVLVGYYGMIVEVYDATPHPCSNIPQIKLLRNVDTNQLIRMYYFLMPIPYPQRETLSCIELSQISDEMYVGTSQGLYRIHLCVLEEDRYRRRFVEVSQDSGDSGDSDSDDNIYNE